MKRLLSKKKATVVLAIVTLASILFYAYMIARPISLGMAYQSKTETDGGIFEAEMAFYSDGTRVSHSTHQKEEFKSRYYYKGGYVFFVLAQTEAAYEKEVAFINDNFDVAVHRPFYAAEIHAFRLVAREGDGSLAVYTCRSAIAFAAIGGAAIAVLIGLSAASVYFLKKKGSVTANG